MMNRIKINLIVFALANLIFTSCYDSYGPCIDATGRVDEELRELDDFSEIHNNLNADVFITQGSVQEVRVSARRDVLGLIRTSVSGDELIIDSRRCFSNADIEIYITTPDINGIYLSGSGYILGEDVWVGESIDLRVSGSGKMDIELEYDNVDARISGSGKISIYGNAVNLDTRISGSGDFEGFGLFCDEAEVNISGSGRCETTVNDFLDVNISGSGRVYYRGTPQISTNISGSGRVINDN